MVARTTGWMERDQGMTGASGAGEVLKMKVVGLIDPTKGAVDIPPLMQATADHCVRCHHDKHLQ